MEKRRILVVEDDNFIAKSYKRKLEEEGFDVVIAGNGAEAIELLKNNSPVDLIILDLIMPVMDGFQFLERIKSEQMQVPDILILTNLNEGEAKDRAGELGVGTYLVKANISLKELLEKIRGALGA